MGTPETAIDLRSDTLTLPTEAMRQAMYSAPLGDDVIDIDPTVARLQSQVAEMTGKEAAIFMPSGTMTNQIALRIHCRPGDEFVCDEGCHIYNFEQGAYAQLSGLAARPLRSVDSQLTLDLLKDVVRPASEHQVRTRLLTLENTHNRGGGRVLPWSVVQEGCEWAKRAGLATHLDGARLFNAIVASGVPLHQWCAPFDTVSLCFSKGLGAPVGSILVGQRDAIALARRHRKLFGGAMRQSGVLAAAALYALDHQIDRLVEDHEHAQILATGVRQAEGLTLDPATVDTNIVIFKVDASIGTAVSFVEQLAKLGVRAMPFSHEHVRLVTYLGITKQAAQQASIAIQKAVKTSFAKNP